MSVTDRQLNRLRSTYQDAREAHQEAKEAFEAALQRRDELKREAERAEAEIENLEARADEDALLASPGGGTAVAPQVKKKLQQLRGQASELKTRIETRKKAKAKADEAARRAALELARALRERRSSVAVRYRKALEHVGEAVVGPYTRYVEARDELAAVDADLKRAVSASGADGRQLQRLRATLKQGDRGLSGAALLGWLVVVVVGFARRFDSGPLAEFLTEKGLPLVDGSPRHAKPLGAREQLVSDLEDGRLPGGTTRL